MDLIKTIEAYFIQIPPMSPIEIAAVIFGLFCVWLTIRQNIWRWPTGLAQVTN